MHLIVIFGPAAVGKMTVGLELEQRTGLRLFHNHLSIDFALRFFPFDSPQFARLVRTIRTQVFEEVASSELPGLIFTYVWALNESRDKESIDKLSSFFTARAANVGYVELFATQEERLRRNASPLRLSEKQTKRDLERSRAVLLQHDAEHQLNSNGDFFYPEKHLRIDNTQIEPRIVAAQIMERFSIPSVSAG
jgi:hypothetical protein